MSWPQAAGLLGGFALVYSIGTCVYNVYFHPLRHLPGPKLWQACEAVSAYHYSQGKYPFVIKDLHKKYGPIVRHGPNSVSFNTGKAWKDIYGHVGGRKQFLKTDFYDVTKPLPPSVVHERDPSKHGAKRKLMSNAFSAKALKEQESTVQHYVDMLVTQIGKHCSGEKGGNMVAWYNWCTFDIIGDMAFSEPFGSLKEAKPHFWIENIFGSIKRDSLLGTLRDYPLVLWILRQFETNTLKEAKSRHNEFTLQKMQKRLSMHVPDNTHKDLLQKVIQERDAHGLDLNELASEASVLVIAGSETTASALSGLTYYLLKNRGQIYERVVSEIRETFSSYEEIDAAAVEKIPYLNAVLNETLRIFPPVPANLPRSSSGETVENVYIPTGTIVSITAYAATHSEDNFYKPDDFIPERWIDPECTDKFDASVPFSMGSRVCLGRSLALMELRIIVAKMLWVYDMELLNKEEDWIGNNTVYAIWNKPELRVRYTRRPGITFHEIAGCA